MPLSGPFTHLLTATSIRLLDIDPGNTGDSLVCTFHEVDLESSAADPLFSALSYKWGDNKDNRKITVNGHAVVVRRNLYDFLLRARQEGWLYNLWIDALCINQKDIRERNRQVAMMGHIYSRAYRVLIWLGPLGEVESHGLLEFFERCEGENNSVRGVSFGDDFRTLERMRYRWSSLSPSCRRGMVRVLQNPYWLRKWIIQEVFLSGQTAQVVTCHSSHWTSTIPITRIAKGVSHILGDFFLESSAWKPAWEYHMGDYRRYPGSEVDRGPYGGVDLLNTDDEKIDALQLWSFRRFIGYDPNAARFRYTSATGLPLFWETLGDATMTFKPQHLITLMDTFRRHSCSMQHDNVYALLGLADLKPGSLEVDYSCSIEDLARAVWAAMKDDFEGHEVDNCILYTLQIRNRENFSLEPRGCVNKVLDRLKCW
ncbi:uncharacterized protein Z519_04636 [Cladophialophora bantiana CBS 173.52]|uniref:Heterokaryon incompatibility domain-containing protein n=1 Tax=Cladophialophora bantiana (strain ATCC 10958 / CBS 173.52 / CDC B-1940 / NIH 8579) TaxID=1442370 RepID=A0A0D2ID25_CLAB1|nr:uncharacterized protein Z519_04636 [Cladophialophora bantiana CBS 173.52]KIW94659.1 hypothetical protein Z519_04636 [Cladophialophora bantiana CBS 173.52]